MLDVEVGDDKVHSNKTEPYDLEHVATALSRLNNAWSILVVDTATQVAGNFYSLHPKLQLDFLADVATLGPKFIQNATCAEFMLREVQKDLEHFVERNARKIVQDANHR